MGQAEQTSESGGVLSSPVTFIRGDPSFGSDAKAFSWWRGISNTTKHRRITFVTDVLASCLSLTMAYLGYGYWSLVAAIVFTALLNCFRFNRLVDYPKWPSFILRGTEELFKFGAFVALSEVIFVPYNRVDIVVVGKFFDITHVGFYGVAIQLATMLMIKSVPLFNVVAFPAFARMNAVAGDRNDYLITTLGFASALIFPIFIGVATMWEELIELVLGSKWVQISGLFVIIVVSVPLRVLAYVISPVGCLGRLMFFSTPADSRKQTELCRLRELQQPRSR